MTRDELQAIRARDTDALVVQSQRDRRALLSHLDEQDKRLAQALDAMHNFYAMVQGESPNILEDDGNTETPTHFRAVYAYEYDSLKAAHEQTLAMLKEAVKLLTLEVNSVDPYWRPAARDFLDRAGKP